MGINSRTLYHHHIKKDTTHHPSCNSTTTMPREQRQPQAHIQVHRPPNALSCTVVHHPQIVRCPFTPDESLCTRNYSSQSVETLPRETPASLTRTRPTFHHLVKENCDLSLQGSWLAGPHWTSRAARTQGGERERCLHYHTSKGNCWHGQKWQRSGS